MKFISRLLSCVGLFIVGRVKILSSQDTRNSLSENYLKRLPALQEDDVCVCINNTYMIFHSNGGLSISNKYNVISSEVLIADHREGYCESVSAIQPFEEPDDLLQPRVILEKIHSLK